MHHIEASRGAAAAAAALACYLSNQALGYPRDIDATHTGAPDKTLAALEEHRTTLAHMTGECEILLRKRQKSVFAILLGTCSDGGASQVFYQCCVRPMPRSNLGLLQKETVAHTVDHHGLSDRPLCTSSLSVTLLSSAVPWHAISHDERQTWHCFFASNRNHICLRNHDILYLQSCIRSHVSAVMKTNLSAIK
jgi:hypothetical protein